MTAPGQDRREEQGGRDQQGAEHAVTHPAAARSGQGDRGAAGAATRARRLLTFRLDLELRQRLRSRLTGEGRSLSEVVIHGLQLYLQQSAPHPGEVPQRPGEAAQGKQAQGKQAHDKQAHDKQAHDKQDRSPAWPTAEPAGSARAPGLAGTAVARVADLALPDEVAAALRDLRGDGHSELLSATLAALHEAGWPLRPLATALGISRQAVLARVRQQVPAEVRSRVPAVAPPAPFPRRRSARPEARRTHITVKIDHALRAAAHREAQREGSSLSQVIERILDHYLRHGLPHGEISLGDTTPTRPATRRKP